MKLIIVVSTLQGNGAVVECSYPAIFEATPGTELAPSRATAVVLAKLRHGPSLCDMLGLHREPDANAAPAAATPTLPGHNDPLTRVFRLSDRESQFFLQK